jgi:hypothetical protein
MKFPVILFEFKKIYIDIMFQFSFKRLAAKRYTVVNIKNTHIITKNRRLIHMLKTS